MSQETHHQPVADISTVSLDPGTEERLNTLASLETRFDRLIEGRSPESLRQPGEDGRWGVVEILCHLRDWEQVVHARVRRILEEVRPEFDVVDATLWPLEHEYGQQDSREVFGDLAARRRELVEMLRGIDRDTWDRTGVTDTGDEVTLQGLIDMVILHDEQYLQEAREAIA